MLSQAQGADGISDRFPIAYASRLLNKAEINYGITDLEGLAVSWAISYFETYGAFRLKRKNLLLVVLIFEI